MTRTCINVFNSRDADEPASMAPGFYAYPHDDYDREAVGPFATPALAICAARAEEGRTSSGILPVLDVAAVSQQLVAARLRVRKSWNTSVMSWRNAGSVLDAIDAVMPDGDLRDAYECMQFAEGIVFA